MHVSIVIFCLRLFFVNSAPTGQNKNFVYIQKFIGQLGARENVHKVVGSSRFFLVLSFPLLLFLALPLSSFCNIGKDVATPTEF
jgi:hypothetical protein